MVVPRQAVLIVLCSLILATIGLPICHDNIPFSTKLAQSSLVVYGDILETSTLLPVDNSTKPFNITFLVKCTLKGVLPRNQNIIIERSLPDNLICYRTLVNGYAYVYFLNQTNIDNYYQQMPFHELSFSEDATIEVLKRTCGIQVRPFHEIVEDNNNKIDEQCPVVSIGCL